KRVYGYNFYYFYFAQYLKADLFNADEWITLFKKAGSNYIVFTSKHHDGFCLWNTKTTNKNSMKENPHRDFLKELKTACEKQDMRFGLYYSLTEWHNPYFRWTIDSVGLDKYVEKHLIPQFKELVDNYRPVLLFSDGDWDFSYKELRSEELVQYLYDKVGKEAIVNDRWGRDFAYGFKTPEYSSGIKERNRPWSECRSLARSFALNRISSLEDYFSPKDLVHHFVQLVSLGGGLMLNVGPSADGQIPLLQQERLIQLGSWLKVNGEAIYGSKPYKKEMDYKGKEEKITSKTLDFNWVRNAPVSNCTEDNFSICWSNTYTAKQNERYTFSLKADDSAEIEILQEGKTKYKGKATKEKPLEFDFEFKKNVKYLIKVNYTETDIDASLYFYAQKDKETPFAFVGDSLWQGKVRWQQPNICYTTNKGNLYCISMEELSKEISIRLEDAPKKNMKIRLLGNEDKDLTWEYKNGVLRIDLSPLAFENIRSKYAYVFRLEGYL
ncbi:MAG: alpha-L-fucosidase, partial [Bacteroidota bacterium]|nr:alpha-L-fucosidase [Bacteroidota bacterium]